MITLADFEGRWRITREIDDRRAGLRGGLRGTATWRSGADGMWVQEIGEMQFGHAAPMQATRRYIWRSDGPRIAAFFDDGRAFHAFDPNAAEVTAHHECPPDLYRVRYDFSAWPDWTSAWDISGPRKDLGLITRFRPEAA